jgi:predicted nucleic acid-binding protein
MPTRLIVADTGPLNYLILIEAIDALPRLFEHILIPALVYDELAHAEAPAPVRNFVARQPTWLEIRPNPSRNNDEALDRNLDDGEWAAIALARTIGADLILIDDRAGVAAARRYGLAVTGTIGVLDLAARRGLIDLGTAIAKLKTTNFRYPPEVMDALLAQHRERKS